jgi:hypothetical protein
MEELDEGIERFQRASLDLDMQERGSIVDLGDDHEDEASYPSEQRQPASAPVTKTTFFVEPEEQVERRRPRTGSEVVSPSPLAREWAQDSDSDVPRQGIRRVQTEIIHPQSLTPPLRINPPSPVTMPMTKPRSATLPSGVPGIQPVGVDMG